MSQDRTDIEAPTSNTPEATRRERHRTSIEAVTAVGLALVPQAARLAELALVVPGLGSLVATVTTAVGLGINSRKWIHDDRAKRVARRLLTDRDVTIDQFRAVWAPNVDRESVSRQLRAYLEAIDQARENETADVLLNVLRYRTKYPEDRRFSDSALELFRGADLATLRATRSVLVAALAAGQTAEIALYNNRTLSDSPSEPGVLLGGSMREGGRLTYLTPLNGFVGRRMFQRIKAANLGRATSTSGGNYFSDGSDPPPTESQDESLVVERVVAEKIVALLVAV